MARVATFSKDEIVRANELRDHAKTVEEMQRALAVLLMAEGQMEAEKASSLLGISKRTLFDTGRVLIIKVGLCGRPGADDGTSS